MRRARGVAILLLAVLAVSAALSAVPGVAGGPVGGGLPPVPGSYPSPVWVLTINGGVPKRIIPAGDYVVVAVMGGRASLLFAVSPNGTVVGQASGGSVWRAAYSGGYLAVLEGLGDSATVYRLPRLDEAASLDLRGMKVMGEAVALDPSSGLLYVAGNRYHGKGAALIAVRLSDGSVAWNETLPGTLLAACGGPGGGLALIASEANGSTRLAVASLGPGGVELLGNVTVENASLPAGHTPGASFSPDCQRAAAELETTSGGHILAILAAQPPSLEGVATLLNASDPTVGLREGLGPVVWTPGSGLVAVAERASPGNVLEVFAPNGSLVYRLNVTRQFRMIQWVRPVSVDGEPALAVLETGQGSDTVRVVAPRLGSEVSATWGRGVLQAGSKLYIIRQPVNEPPQLVEVHAGPAGLEETASYTLLAPGRLPMAVQSGSTIYLLAWEEAGGNYTAYLTRLDWRRPSIVYSGPGPYKNPTVVAAAPCGPGANWSLSTEVNATNGSATARVRVEGMVSESLVLVYKQDRATGNWSLASVKCGLLAVLNYRVESLENAESAALIVGFNESLASSGATLLGLNTTARPIAPTPKLGKSELAVPLLGGGKESRSGTIVVLASLGSPNKAPGSDVPLSGILSLRLHLEPKPQQAQQGQQAGPGQGQAQHGGGAPSQAASPAPQSTGTATGIEKEGGIAPGKPLIIGIIILAIIIGIVVAARR